MQVKEKVNASNLLMVGMQTAERGRAAKAGETDFASFLSQSAGSAEVNPQKSSERKSLAVDTDKRSGEISNQQETTSEPVKKAENANKASETPEKAVEEKTESLLTDTGKDEEEIQTIADGIMQMLMGQFNLTPEQLADKLEAAGMQAEDLLTAGGLKEFFLQMENAEISDLVVNEELNQKWNTLYQEFEQLLPTDTDSGLVKEVAQTLEASLLADSIPEGKEAPVKGMPKQESPVTDNGEGADREMPISAEPEVVLQKESAGSTFGNGQSENPDTDEQAGAVEKKDIPEASAGRNGFENPILQAIRDAVNQVEEVEMPAEPVRGEEVIKQLVEQIRVNLNQDNTSLEMQLYPQHLGRIQLNVVAKDGIMTARIVAETEAAKQAIEGGLTSLKESMEQQNLKVDAIEVMVSTTGFEQSSQNQEQTQQNSTAKNGRRLQFLDGEEEIPEEDAAEAEKMRAAGSSVSFSA
ncbi:MAG: flagellar hook-length control protein FliK [Bacteroidales bacterium]|nr:flagellar hook-length control protein FliK [Clostridium sp.]MCM1202726.1 flagellar hook-length control protein FliK [Bacteroidales bacterium]